MREPEDRPGGHAAEAVHTPLGALNPEKVPRDRIVVAVCRSGARSGKAAIAPADTGVNVRNMAGGMNGWSAANLPVTRDGQPDMVA